MPFPPTLITGATSGIGRAVAEGLCGSGESVVGVGRNAGVLAEIGGMWADSFSAVASDLTAEGAVEEVVDQLGGPVAGVVHAAGLSLAKPIRFLGPADLDRLWAINVRVPLLLTRALLKAGRIAEGGSVVFVSSVAASVGSAGYSGYAATKGALEAAMRSLVPELARMGIRVNAVAPGLVATPMGEESLRQSGAADHGAKYPLGPGRVDDVVHAIRFLLDPRARWITGATLPVDGGYSAVR